MTDADGDDSFEHDDDDAPDAPQFPWQKEFDRNDDGKRTQTLANAIHAFTMHPEWAGVVAYNAFDGSIVKVSEPPMRPTERPKSFELGEWNDTDTSLATAWLARAAKIRLNPQLVGRAIYAVAQQRVFHPVRDYLGALEWDGKVRLPALLSRYMGAANTELHEAVGSRWMISAVARVMVPGCKADHALVLEGEQGVGKSTAVEVLASSAWYSDTPIIFGEKDSYEALRGVWIYELAELSAFRKSDSEAQKAYISKRNDRYRRPYGEGPILWPRQVVFAGTTNDERYLIDPTGNRRFWPVRCSKVDIAALTADRDQLWAEALVRFNEGERWHLDTPELVAMAREVQEERVHEDDWETLTSRWLQTERCQLLLVPGDGLAIVDILSHAILLKSSDMGKSESTRMGIVMRKLGWVRRKVTLANGTREWRVFGPSTKSQVDHEAGQLSLGGAD